MLTVIYTYTTFLVVVLFPGIMKLDKSNKEVIFLLIIDFATVKSFRTYSRRLDHSETYYM